jgi:hypothetical protein
MNLSALNNIINDGFKIAAFVDPALAPVASIEASIAAALGTPEALAAMNTVSAALSRVSANHGVTLQAVATASARGRQAVGKITEQDRALWARDGLA